MKRYIAQKMSDVFDIYNRPGIKQGIGTGLVFGGLKSISSIASGMGCPDLAYLIDLTAPAATYALFNRYLNQIPTNRTNLRDIANISVAGIMGALTFKAGLNPEHQNAVYSAMDTIQNICSGNPSYSRTAIKAGFLSGAALDLLTGIGYHFKKIRKAQNQQRTNQNQVPSP